MRRKRALFITLDALHFTDYGGDPRALSVLRDYAACGFRIIVISDPTSLRDLSCGNRVELLHSIRTHPRSPFGLPIADVLVMHNPYDPAPFWDAARRFSLSLDTSIFVSRGGEITAAAKNAGVMRSEGSAMMPAIAA